MKQNINYNKIVLIDCLASSNSFFAKQHFDITNLAYYHLNMLSESLIASIYLIKISIIAVIYTYFYIILKLS